MADDIPDKAVLLSCGVCLLLQNLPAASILLSRICICRNTNIGNSFGFEFCYIKLCIIIRYKSNHCLAIEIIRYADPDIVGICLGRLSDIRYILQQYTIDIGSTAHFIYRFLISVFFFHITYHHNGRLTFHGFFNISKP